MELYPSRNRYIVGNIKSADSKAMLKALRRPFLPNKVLLFKEVGSTDLDTISAYTKLMTAIKGKATAYVCENFACQLPTTDTAKLMENMKPKEK